LNVFLYPAYFLKSKLYDRHEAVLSFDQEVGKLDGLRKDYVSALFKVGHLPTCGENSVGGLVINELSHVKNQTEDVLGHLLINHVSIEARVKALK
jgi:hypothetical protein